MQMLWYQILWRVPQRKVALLLKVLKMLSDSIPRCVFLLSQGPVEACLSAVQCVL